MSDDSATSPARFGAAPLEQTRQAAAAMRRLTGLLLSLEHSHPAVEDMLARFPEWERELRAISPQDTSPRIGENATPDQRIYLDHAFDVGDYNPCFPEYRFEHLDPEHAHGRVNFPVAYEGPPGLVHGGFLALFFDCVVQQQNCATGRAGKTRTLTLTYRRPTPLLTDLRFELKRTLGQRDIESEARLLLDDTVLCSATVSAVSADPAVLPGVSHGVRVANGEQ